MIHAVLPSNQLLRPWDNVPRMALGQEIVGNRLVYGNYLQNYNLEGFGQKNIKVDIEVQIKNHEIGNILPEEVQAGPDKKPTKYNPAKSLKSLRTYQLGVVYIDQYGRETPVFSDSKSQHSIYNKKENAVDRTNFRAIIKSDPPAWATHFKYFVKETSNEYYNLAMDRWYNAEDGNIWLSFPSAERNKVDEETFLILKKEHDNNKAVPERARYKILAISNEAPRFIKLINNILCTVQDQAPPNEVIGPAGSGFPLVDGTFVDISAVDFIAHGLDKSIEGEKGIANCFMRVRSDLHVSNWYPIKSVGKDGIYRRITSKTRFKEDMGHTSADGSLAGKVTNCKLEIARREETNKAEFDGRFFAKILKDNTLIERLGISLTPTIGYQTTAVQRVQYIDPMAVEAPGSGGWFGQHKKRLSVDPKNTAWWSRPGGGGPWNAGDGPDYWNMAGDNLDVITSNSSGWFIDKVEAYRPSTGSWQGKSIGKRWDVDCPPSASWFPWSYCNTGTTPSELLNVMAMDVYGPQGAATFLDSEQVASPGNTLKTRSRSSGGNIVDSLGIDQSNSIIHISYAGINTNGTSPSAYNSTTWNNLDDHAFDATAAKHVDDIIFIEKLRAPGTLWEWKEDPGIGGESIVYRTITPDNLSATSSPYTQSQYDGEIIDVIDTEPGILLFNYANLVDYVIRHHHKYIIDFWWDDGISGPWGDYITSCSASGYHWKRDWVSRAIGNHEVGCGTCLECEGQTWGGSPSDLAYSPQKHDNVSGADQWEQSHNVTYPIHYKYPMGIWEWDTARNKRRRFTIFVEVAGVAGQESFEGQAVGSVGPHFYLPTNDCTAPAHFDVNLGAITTNPVTGAAFATPAPGIRPDGMYTGHDQPGVGTWEWHNGAEVRQETKIPDYKRWDYENNETKIPGSVTWRILESFVDEGDGEAKFSSTNPAIWETEPKEDVGLDIYHEIGQIYPIYLNDDTIEQFVGPINSNINTNSYVRCWDPPYISVPGAAGGAGTISLQTDTICDDDDGDCNKDIRVSAAYDNFVQLSDTTNNILGSNPGHTLPVEGAFLMFWRADGSVTEAHVRSMYQDPVNNGTWFELSGNVINGDIGVHNKMVDLPWFNCYSFGNGVESDRIRDDFNQVTIDNGPKASTTLEEPYSEDRRKSGFIWSGIYNSKSGVNNLNQFIQAEAITKDVNPSYGSIQKLSVRDSDLVAFCEDRVLKVLADKDALFNADGNTNVVATNKVLGTARPFAGDYGISKNPESFASDSYRSYFTDTSRGAVVRLSQDGLTPISDAGMKDWFADNLPKYTNNVGVKLIGSFDDKKQEYNITLNANLSRGIEIYNDDGTMSFLDSKTLSYSENSKGWVSFKSFIQENGVSLNNSYYTLKLGKLYEHHVNETRNNFYNNQFDSSVDTLFNQSPSVIKSFSTLNYEGSQSKITQDILTNPDYYDNIPKAGWYVKEMISNAQELGEMEFWDKEDKWFSQIKGVKTQWLGDGTAGNIDPREFSYQGIGNSGGGVSCPDCPPPLPSWNCTPGYFTTIDVPGTPGSPEIPGTPGIPGTPEIPYQAAVPATAAIPEQPFVPGSPEIPGTPEIPGVDEYLGPAGIGPWQCTPTTGTSSVGGGQGCYNTGLPTGGYYATETECEMYCGSYSCNGMGDCNQMLFGGEFYTEAECQSACGQGGNYTFPQLGYIAGVPGTPATPTIPAVDEIPYSPYIPAVPGTPEILYQAEVPGIPGTPTIPAVPPTSATQADGWVYPYCEQVTTFPSNGEFSSLALCEDTCLVPPTWNCLTAFPAGWPQSGAMPINYCNEVFDGSGDFTSLANCEENCPEYEEEIIVDPVEPIDPSWACSGPNGSSMLDGTYVPPYTCFDPGNGSGMYSVLGDCEKACSEPDILVGPCIINDATVYVGNSSYPQGSVINFNGLYYTASIQIPALSPNPWDIGNNWTPCEPNYSGPCNLDAAVGYDNINTYSEGTIIEYINASGNSVYYYNLQDVPSNHWATPGLGDTIGGDYDALTNTTNPWMPCADSNDIPDVGGCDVSNYTIYDDTVTYDLNNTSQVNINNEIVVWYEGNFWFLDCGFTWNQIDTGNCCFLADGTELDPMGGSVNKDIIQDGWFSCLTGGITGIAPGQLIQDSDGNDLPGTGYWVQCNDFGGTFVDAYQACCVDFAANYNPGCVANQASGFYTDPASGVTFPVASSGTGLCTCLYTAPGCDFSGSSGTGCFAKGDKVEMFNGTLKAIELVKIGDEVKSIKNNKVVKGIVTDLLIHPTNDVVEVIKINGITSEPDHPIFVNGKWIAAKTLGNISNEFIGNWYNLEIDGNTENSEHNYIIGGLIVSGLGDNVKLNSKYQRQPKRLTEYLNL